METKQILDVDETVDGKLGDVANGNATVEDDITWNAGDTVSSIKNKMTTGTNIYYIVTTNNPVQQSVRSTTGESIGVRVIGHGNCVLTLSNIINESIEHEDYIISETKKRTV